MPRLFIQTHLNSVCIVGEFCGWDVDKAIRVDRQPGRKMLCVHDMPEGEYRVLSCKSYTGGEIYPTDGRQMPNRYFGTNDEQITVYFKFQ
jgi:hypothetical protein